MIIMLSTTVKIPQNKSVELKIPDLSRSRFLVLSSLSVLQSEDSKSWTPAKDLDLRLKNGNTELLYVSYGLLGLKHQIVLNDLNKEFLRGYEKMVLTLKRNNNTEILYFYKIICNFVPTNGTLLYQYSYESPENVLNDVFNNLNCVNLVLHFNLPIKSAELQPIYESSDFSTTCQWLSCLELGETDAENCYIIDFTNSELIEYAKNLEYMKLKLPDNLPKDKLKITVLAYGFHKSL